MLTEGQTDVMLEILMYTANMSNQSATRVQLIVAKKHELQLLIASNF